MSKCNRSIARLKITNCSRCGKELLTLSKYGENKLQANSNNNKGKDVCVDCNLISQCKKINNLEKITKLINLEKRHRVTAIIISKGRLYFKAKYPDKNWTFQIIINDISKNYEIGESITFLATKEVDSSQYGIKTKYTPFNETDLEIVELSELKRWLGYVLDKCLDKCLIAYL